MMLLLLGHLLRYLSSVKIYSRVINLNIILVHPMWHLRLLPENLLIVETETWWYKIVMCVLTIVHRSGYLMLH